MDRCSEGATPAGAQRHRLDTPAGQSWSRADEDDSELDVFAAERYFNGNDALWCARSSSSLSSSAFRMGTTHERDRSVVTTTTTAVATSSSEASWNSRSALLPEGRRPLADVAPGVQEPEASGSEPPHREKPPPQPSHLRRWLLGVAGCACIGGGDGGEGSASADDDDLCNDEVEDGDGSKKLVTDGVEELFQSRVKSKELAVAEAATSATARPGSWWLDDGQDVLPGGAAAYPRVQVVGDDSHHRQPVNPDEYSAQAINPATTTVALLQEQRRRKSPETLRRLGDTWSALPSVQHDFTAFRIVAGNTSTSGGALRVAAAGHGGGRSSTTPRWPGTTSRCDWSDDDDDSAAPVELVAGCPYPPSEASVDWSVVTAEGVASCNFSSAASGYYYHLNGASRPTAGRDNSRSRRCGVTNGGSLLTCMGSKAVDAVRPAPRLGDHDVVMRRG